MSDTALPVLLVGATRERADAARAELLEVAQLVVQPNLHQALDTLRACEARVVLVDFASQPDAALAMLEHLHREEPRAELLAVNDEPDAQLEALTARAGAKEFVVTASGALRRAVADRVRAPRGSKGRVITIFPTKGGVGATALAVNLAGCLEASGGRTLLVDLRLALGDVEAFLDLRARFSIADVLRLMRTLERDRLFASLARHGSGVDVLTQGDRVEEIDQITPDQVTRLLDFVARHYDFVVVDGVHDFDEHELAAMDASDRVLLLLTQEAPSLRNAQRCLRLFKQLRYDDGRVAVVLNRYRPDAGADPEAIAEYVGVPLAATVSNDYAAMTKAIHDGVLVGTVAPSSPLTEDLRRLAALVAS